MVDSFLKQKSFNNFDLMRLFLYCSAFVWLCASQLAVAANPWFDSAAYAKMNPEVTREAASGRAAGAEQLQLHYLNQGLKKGLIGRLAAAPYLLRKTLEEERMPPDLMQNRDSLDVQRDFTVGGEKVTVLVRGPQSLAKRARKTFRLKGEEESVVAYLSAALDLVRQESLGALTFPKQTLRVEAPADESYQLIIRDIQDVGLDFSGSTLLFTDPARRGVLVTGNLKRVRFHNLIIDWSLDFFSPAQVQLAADGAVTLKVEKALGTLPIAQFFGFYDVANKRWSASADSQWTSFDPSIAQTGDSGNYTAEELNVLRPFLAKSKQLTGLVRHHAPGKLSVVVTGDEVEDVQFTQIQILNSAYMGIGVDRIKRGFLLKDSVVMPKSGAHASTASDAVHITSSRDLILENNRFIGMGDDGLNIQSYTYALSEAASPGQFEVHSNVFRPKPGDRLAVYSPVMDFLGTATLSEAAPMDAALTKHTVKLADTDGLPLKPGAGFRIGILRQHPVRFVVQNNEYAYNRSRAMVIQGSLGLILNNKITAPTSNAILVATDAENWSEGLGATSLIFQGNIIQSANFFGLNRTSRNLGAISVISEVASPGGVPEFVGMPAKSLATYPLFQNLHFIGNTISGCQGAGIFVSSARDVNFTANKIVKPILEAPKGAPGWGSSHGIAELAPVTLFRTFGIKSDEARTSSQTPKAVELSPAD